MVDEHVRNMGVDLRFDDCRMSLPDAISIIEKMLNKDIIEKIKEAMKRVEIEDRICLCNHNMCMHENGEGGSPSPCEEEDCMCSDYDYNFPRSLLYDKEKWYRNYYNKEYPHLPLVVIIQGLGFNTSVIEALDNFYTWNGDPATKPTKSEETILK